MPTDSQTFESYRPLLFSIAYRMLGSAMEAEDMVQETFLRFAPVQNVRSTKSYLTTIVTRLCIDRLKSAKTQRETYIGEWLPEPVLTGDSPSAIAEKHESISMAFLVLLENLSPVERAIFLLREVFDYPYAEIAEIVDKSEANCRQYYHRAKQSLADRRSRYEPSSAEQLKLVQEFLRMMKTGDVEGLTHMLAEEVTFHGDGGGKVSAVRRPLFGPAAVVRFLLLGVVRLLPAGTRTIIADVNGTQSILFWGDDNLYFVMNLTIVDNKIAAIRNILNPDKLTYIRQQYLQEHQSGRLASKQSQN
jgi:RNA polymerase sigma-70 factor (ECF subfamily)